ncbi:MAG: hypothetical protein Fur0035_07560 [Anaerolineales bacterium]
MATSAAKFLSQIVENGKSAISSHFPLIAALSILAAVYGQTLAPGLTWANDGADGGDLISASFRGGVPHPPGYPLYLALSGLALKILPGSPALRLNIFSALCALAAAGLAYRLILRLSGEKTPAFVAALSLGLTPAFWGQAVIAEVYSLQIFLLLAVFYQTLFSRRDLLRGITFGLAISHHLSAIFLLPALLFDGSQSAEKKAVAARIFFAALTAFLLYASLMPRAASQPPVNWGHADSLARLWPLVSGEIYQGYLQPGADNFPQKSQAAAGLIFDQLGAPALILALMALLNAPRREVFRALTALTVAAQLCFALFYQTRDWQINLLPIYTLSNLWAGLGLAQVSQKFRPLGPILTLLVLTALTVNTARHWQSVDASRDQRAEDFSRLILSKAPPDAILLTSEDRDTFALWYHQHVLRERPDLVILPLGLLNYDWARQTLRETYLNFNLPAAATSRQEIFAANPQRPVCAIFVEPQSAYFCK